MAQSDQERWRRLQPILDELLELSADERRTQVDEILAHHPDLRTDLEALLRADAETGGVLDAPSAQLVDEGFRGVDSHSAGDALLPGTRVGGRYRIVSLLGRGGMGEVYRADDLKLGQAVALKFVPEALRSRPDWLTRFLEEAKLARHVSHPNVCRVYDIGEWNGHSFLSMEFIDGEDLASLIRRIGALPRPKALDIARQLCAGLEAAHQLGILHRDLKPANVILDGRGHVRITDFGLAVATSRLQGREALAGTPGYMSPEQLDGREATARSDVYGLGLVLYELFTGHRAFRFDSVQELRRLQQDSSPANPSTLVDNFDPAVERAILRCLESDPALRPASARDVAMLLPGGDPIAAALAAGETPSPELVAASGPEGALRPVVALRILAAGLFMLAVSVLLVDRASILDRAGPQRSLDVLEDNARGILVRFGYDLKAIDSWQLLATNRSWSRYVYAHDRSANRWHVLRDPGQWGMLYSYRQAERSLTPLGRNAWITGDDPALGPRDVLMVTTVRGRLVYLLVVPDEAEPPVESSAATDWSALFREAGLDPNQFQPTAPTRNPPVTADVRAAWSGTLAEFGGYPVRVEAAAHRSKPVFFEIVAPWDPYWNPASTGGSSPGIFPTLGYVLMMLFAVGIGAVLAVRNWFSGRGDRRGAFRLAAIVFSLRFGVWIVGGHHVASFGDETVMLLIAFSRSLTDAGITWCIYLALEPYGRRVHSRLLVSWTRLLRGRARDPLVGRDVLYGVALAAVAILFLGQLYVVIPHALHLPAPPVPRQHPLGSPPFLYFLDTPSSRTLLGGRHVVAEIPALALQAFAATLLWLMILVGLHLVLRNARAAVVMLVAMTALLLWPSTQSHFNAIAVACAFVGAIVIAWALRYGLVGLLTVWFCVFVWMNFPITANTSAPYFGTGLVGILIIASLGAYGAIVAADLTASA